MRMIMLLSIILSLTFGLNPPEIPDLPRAVLWCPNTATLPQQGALIQETFNWIREKMDEHGFQTDLRINNNNFSEFLELFEPSRYGYYLLLTHGGGAAEPNWIMLEAHLAETTAVRRVNELRLLYPGEEANIMKRPWTSQDPPIVTYYCVSVNSIFINNRGWSLRDAFMFIPTHPNRYNLLIEGNNQMKFYNSPRIVGLEIKQAGRIIYRYRFDPQSYYPYEWDYPGDLSGCPKNPAVVGNQPLEFQILFSSPMNPTQEPPRNIKVYVTAGQGNFAIPVTGNWAKSIFDNDWWSGACDFSEWSDKALPISNSFSARNFKNSAIDLGCGFDIILMLEDEGMGC